MRRYAQDLLALEGDLAALMKARRPAVRAAPTVAEALERNLEMIGRHQLALASYLGINGIDGHPRASAFRGFVGDREGTRQVSDLLRDDYAAFTYAAMSYAVLLEFALRLYDPELRDLAPKHLSGYTQAAHTAEEFVFSNVVGELVAEGSECRCICPMCSIGVCGCASASSVTLAVAWREAASLSAAPGFPIEQPRAGSALQRAGIQRGDRLLEVDGQPVDSIFKIQSAIRRHALGDDVRLLLQSGSVVAQHVSDYPPE